jgi:TatD DNase family protein
MQYFDSHCHLHFAAFDDSRDAVLARMRERDVGAVLIGTDIETSRGAVALAEQHDFLWASVGLHPNDNVEEVFDEEVFLELAKHPKVVGVGECGLDYFRSGGTEEEKQAQRGRFEKQIELALKVGKPLIVHCRNAHEDMLNVLSDYMGQHPTLKVIIHFATLSGDVAERFIKLGCYLSFPGPVTYADMYDDSIRQVPLEKFLVETDAPYAAPVPYRGQRNEPPYVVEVIKKIAHIKGLKEETVQAQVLKNTQTVFGLQF